MANDLRLTSSDTSASATNTDVTSDADIAASLLFLFTNEHPPALPTPI
jgi:hypothetical protein